MNPQEVKQEEEKKKEPINYRPIYEAASPQQKEHMMCRSNTAKYCHRSNEKERQAKLLDAFNMTEDEMYAWMVFSYSVKYNYAQPTDGFSPQEMDEEPGLYIVTKK
jgi:hypothetical protein